MIFKDDLYLKWCDINIYISDIFWFVNILIKYKIVRNCKEFGIVKELFFKNNSNW